MKNRLIFPLFNTIVCAVLGGLVGYYAYRPFLGLFTGALVGLILGLGVELLLGRLGQKHWLYRRRVLLLALLEMPIAVFVIGPYAFVLVETQPDQRAVCCETPLDFGATKYEDVQIQTSDGITLSGWYVPPQEMPGAVIVLLHGAHSNRLGVAWHAEQLIEAGYGVLLYDLRAMGESGGETLSFGWFDGPDLLAALDFLAARPEVDEERIGVVGLSLGAHVAINAAYLEPERLAALWLDGAGAQRIKDFPQAENIGERFATFMNGLILKAAEIHLDRPAMPAFVDILAELEQPQMMLVAGGQEDFERRVSQKYAGVAGPNEDVWLIEEAWHVGGATAVPDEYRQRMLTFFATTLEK